MSSIPSATSISNSSPDFDALDGYAQANPTSRRPDPAQQARSSSPSEDGQGFGEKRSAREEGFESLGTRAGLRSREGPGRKRRNVERELEGGSRVPLSPPVDPERFDTEEQWRTYHDEEKTQGWLHIPLVLVALPPLGAIVHGRAENWTDGIILLLICFYLYQLVKVPWEIYYASRTRHILESSISNDGEFEDPVTARGRELAAHSLRRNEMLALLACMVVPAVGSYLLLFARGLLHDADRYINNQMVGLFALATCVKPVLHFSQLMKQNSLFYQEAVWYPSTEVHLLRRRIEHLEKDLSQLSRAFATKSDVRLLRDGLDIPLTQLSKAVRRFDRKEEYLRLSSEERFALMNAKLEEATREVSNQAELLARLRADQDRSSHPISALLHLLGHLLGHDDPGSSQKRQAVKWFERGPFYLIFWPVSVSNLALEWVATKTEGHEVDARMMKAS